MSLTDIVDIVGGCITGFSSGFMGGILGVSNRRTEEIECLENVFSEEEMVEKVKVKKKDRDRIRRIEKLRRFVFPMGVGYGYWVVSNFATLNVSNSRAVAAIFAAYVGLDVGRGLRKLIRRKSKEDLEMVMHIKEHPDRVLEYLPEKIRSSIEEVFGEVERHILEGKGPVESLRDNVWLGRMFDVLMDEKAAYTGVLAEWIKERVKQLASRAHVQRNLVEVCEKVPPLSAAVMGEPKKLAVKVFEFDGKGGFYTHLARFSNVRIVSDEDFEPVETKAPYPEIETLRRERWDGDYRRVAEKVMKDRESYTILFAKTVPGISDSVRNLLVTNCFVPAYVRHQTGLAKEKREKERENESE
jgi:hypothetical protein